MDTRRRQERDRSETKKARTSARDLIRDEAWRKAAREALEALALGGVALFGLVGRATDALLPALSPALALLAIPLVFWVGVVVWIVRSSRRP